MRLAAAAVTLLLLTGTAQAQDAPPGLNFLDNDQKADPDVEAKKQQIDRAYREKIKSQPAQAPAVNDPWGNVRSSDTTQGKGQGSKNR